jgi:hypothetical protein
MPSGSLPVPFESKLHRVLLTAVMNRERFSSDFMTRYHTKWEDAEKRFVGYVKETDDDAIRRDKRKAGDPRYTTIQVPMSYAMLMTAHTYWTSVFLSRSPVHQYMGRHGESDINVSAIDALIDYQVQVGEHLVPYYIWLLDPGRYSFGVLWNFWAEETVTVSQIVDQPVETARSQLGFEPPKSEKVRMTVEMPGYQGNKVFNVQPWDLRPDPRVTLSNLQRGEFCGRVTRVGWNTIMERLASGVYFNIDELRRINRGQQSPGVTDTFTENPGAAQIERPTHTDPATSAVLGDRGFVNLIEMVVELVPRMWHIGEGTRPEKWVFTIAERSVLIGLSPLGAYHNKFPVDVIEYEPEGYGVLSNSLLERADAMNNVMDWLVNSHFFNVRASLANQFIYDPSRLEERDVLDPSPGKMIRLKPEAYGQDIRTMFHQLPVGDVTQNHLRDAQVISEILQRAVGVTDNVMGAVNPGGRKTATEVRTAGSFSVSRLKTSTEYFSAMGFAPLAQKLLQNTQQYYDDLKQFRVAGDLVNRGQTFIDVGPETIQGFYDFVPVDGNMPLDKFAMSNLWRQLMVDMAGIGLAQQYNFGGIFEYVAQMAGLKSIKQFRLQVTPDAQLAAQAAAGNVVPIGGPNGQASTGPGGGTLQTPESFSRPPEPGQLPGLGTSG